MQNFRTLKKLGKIQTYFSVLSIQNLKNIFKGSLKKPVEFFNFRTRLPRGPNEVLEKLTCYDFVNIKNI